MVQYPVFTINNCSMALTVQSLMELFKETQEKWNTSLGKFNLFIIHPPLSIIFTLLQL